MMSLVISTIPNIAFGLKVQIDTVRQVHKLKDFPRKIVVHLNWISTILSWIFPFLPFFNPLPYKINNWEIDSPWKLTDTDNTILQMGRNLLNNIVNLAKSHITMGNHIVGLMSSSYQGGMVDGGKRREVIEKELLKQKLKEMK